MAKSFIRVGSIFQRLLHGPEAVDSGHVIRAEEREFLERVHRVAGEHLADPSFTTANAAECLEMSRMHLNRRLRTLTGKSTHQLIQEMRLESAREVLSMERLTVAAVAERVGFKSVSQFTRAFRLRYGAPPAEYRRQNPEVPPPPKGPHS